MPEMLEAPAETERALRPVRHAGCEVHHRPDRVAGISCGERPVEDVHPLDLVGRDHAPARRGKAVIVADQRREQHAIGIDEAARAGADARGPRRERRLRVPDMALADQQARQVAEHVLGVDDVDRFVGARGREGLDSGGRGRIGALAGNDDFRRRGRWRALVGRDRGKEEHDRAFCVSSLPSGWRQATGFRPLRAQALGGPVGGGGGAARLGRSARGGGAGEVASASGAGVGRSTAKDVPVQLSESPAKAQGCSGLS